MGVTVYHARPHNGSRNRARNWVRSRIWRSRDYFLSTPPTRKTAIVPLLRLIACRTTPASDEARPRHRRSSGYRLQSAAYPPEEPSIRESCLGAAHVLSCRRLRASSRRAAHRLTAADNRPVFPNPAGYAPRAAFTRPGVSRPLSSSRNRSHTPKLAAIPTVSAASSSTSLHRDQRRRRTAPRQRRRSGDGGTD